MPYLRFLTDKDYISIATDEHFRQVTRDNHDRVVQAEQRAEMNMLEYLDQYYEIEKVLSVGKNIREYSPAISYPAQVFFRKGEEIFKTLTRINGYKVPTKVEYWKQVVDYIDPCLIDHAPKYSQLRMYAKGDVVMFGTEYWQCVVPHGFESGEIHIPGIQAWKEAEVVEWKPLLEWKKNDVCSFNGNFYQYLVEDKSEDDETETANTSDNVLTPDEDECWGLIGEYSKDYEYDSSEGSFDYAVAEGTVFYPVLNPNAEALVEGENITRDDPRNINVVAHMSRIALYYLHQLISPTNISETRRWAYEDSMLWLHNASKLKINPQLPRKIDNEDGKQRVDWALATFQKSYDPHENPWLI